MKKLLFVFVSLFMLVLTSGCGAQKNTVRFDGDEKTADSATEENADEAKSSEEDTAKEEALDGEADEAPATVAASNAPSGKLAVTSFDGAYLKTTFSYNVVKGDAPAGTRTIKINDYKLSKYIPGQTKWDYIASTRFGTLKAGLNTYVVKAFDKDGEEIDSVIFSINYEAPAVPNVLPGVGPNLWITLLAALIASATFTLFRKYRWL